MTELVACLGTGKGTWNEVSKLITSESWAKVYIVTNSFGKEKFTSAKAEFIVVDDLLPAEQLVEQIKKGLSGKISDTEIAVNLASGPGNLHMALMSALLKLGLGMRLVVPSDSGAKEL